MDLVRVASPLFNGADPRITVPRLKVTVPVGVGPVEVRFAVKVILCLDAAGLGADVAVVDVVYLFTV
jgi:hypothetical protein